MSMKKQIRMIIVGLVCVALVVGYYYHLSHRSTKTAEDTDRADSDHEDHNKESGHILSTDSQRSD